MLTTARFLFFAAVTRLVVEAYVNEMDQPFDFKCPSGQCIMYASSVHHNHYEDRQWDFLCRTVGTTLACEDSDYVNDFDSPLNFKCPGDKFVTGIRSYHDNHFEDRRYGFQCCSILGRSPRDCYLTGEVNKYDGKLTLAVPEGQAIKGVHSVHHNHYEDRIWTFELCSY